MWFVSKVAPDAGQLNSHPLVQGILIAALEQQKRLEHGVGSMKGLKVSELELSRMSEAGVMLSAAACNKHLLKAFGLAWALPHLPLARLHEKGLPEPFLSVAQDNILSTNASIISDMLQCKTRNEDIQVNPRRLSLAFDKTYLIKGLDIVQIRVGKGYVGAAFDIASLELNQGQGDSKQLSGFLPLLGQKDEKDILNAPGWDPPETEPVPIELDEGDNAQDDSWDAAKVDLATEVCEFLMWCPSLKGLPKMSACSIPLSYEIDKLQMLRLLGHVLEEGGAHIRTIVFDNQSNHNLIKAMLLGKPNVLPKEVLESLPFWSRLEFVNFPETCMPKFPYSRPYIGADALLPGCH